MTGAIVAAMVATSFGGYASAVVDRRTTRSGPSCSRSLLVIVMTTLNIVGLHGGRAGAGDHRQRRARHPDAVRHRHDRQLEPVAARSGRIPGGARDHLERRADLLRVPGFRRHHLHREGPPASGAAAAAGHVPRARDRDDGLRGRLARRVRHPHRRPGRRVRRDRPRGGGQAHPRRGGVRAHGDHGALLDRRGGEREPLPVGGHDRAISPRSVSSRRPSAGGSAGRAPFGLRRDGASARPSSWSSPST